jgi:hypothetical protein
MEVDTDTTHSEQCQDASRDAATAVDADAPASPTASGSGISSDSGSSDEAESTQYDGEIQTPGAMSFGSGSKATMPSAPFFGSAGGAPPPMIPGLKGGKTWTSIWNELEAKDTERTIRTKAAVGSGSDPADGDDLLAGKAGLQTNEFGEGGAVAPYKPRKVAHFYNTGKVIKRGVIVYRTKAAGAGGATLQGAAAGMVPAGAGNGLRTGGLHPYGSNTSYGTYSYNNLKFTPDEGNMKQWTNAKEMAALTVAFGRPNIPIPINPHDDYPMDHYNLMKHYEGFNQQSYAIIQEILTTSDVWYLTELLPIQKYESTQGWKFRIWEFHSHLASRVAYESYGKLVTASERSIQGGIIHWGIEQRSELYFYRKATGQEHWSRQKVQMGNALVETQCLGALVAVLAARRPSPNVIERMKNGYTHSQFVQQISEQIARIGCIQKTRNGLDVLVSSMLRDFRGRPNVKVGNSLYMLILPPDVREYVAMTSEKSRYWETGIPTRNPLSADNLVIQNAGRVRITRRFVENSHLVKVIDPMITQVSVGNFGFFYAQPSSAFKNFDRKTKSPYDTKHCDHKTYTLEADRDDVLNRYAHALLDGSCLWEAEKRIPAGHTGLTNQLGRIYFFDWDKWKGDYPASTVKVPQGHYRYLLNDEQYKTVIGTKDEYVMTLKKFYTTMPGKHGAALWDSVKKHVAFNTGMKETLENWKHKPPGFKSPWAGITASSGDETLLNNVDTHVGALLPSRWWFELALANNIPVFIQLGDTLPDVTLKGASAIGLSDEPGNTLVGPGWYNVGTNTVTGMVTGSARQHSTPVVKYADRVVVAPAAFLCGYIGGNASGVWTFEDRKLRTEVLAGKPQRERSRFIVALPLDYDPDTDSEKYIDITGWWPSQFVPRMTSTGELTPPHIWTLPMYARFWGHSHKFDGSDERATPFMFNEQSPHQVTILARQYQRLWNEATNDYTTIVRNETAIGPHIRSGMMPYIEGRQPLDMDAYGHLIPTNPSVVKQIVMS